MDDCSTGFHTRARAHKIPPPPPQPAACTQLARPTQLAQIKHYITHTTLADTKPTARKESAHAHLNALLRSAVHHDLCVGIRFSIYIGWHEGELGATGYLRL